MAANHTDLEVWQKSLDLVDRVYDLCLEMPAAEKYGITSQIQRAAVSVPANIAEGFARDSTKDLLRHLSIARGSLAEVRTFLIIIKRRNFVAEMSIAMADEFASQTARLLTGLQRSLRQKLRTP
jgi:four helix bundle protein